MLHRRNGTRLGVVACVVAALFAGVTQGAKANPGDVDTTFGGGALTGDVSGASP